jgi:pimeloyl-ACP methyl ester carboxylesterase
VSRNNPATLVLVHGAWHGAWCWETVRQELAGLGVPSIAVDLPGHGAHGGPLSDLAGDAAEVVTAIQAVDGPVVLVGHSYGGVVISTIVATADLPIVGLVFVAAYRLAPGESVAGRAHSWAEPSALSDSIGFDGDALVLDPATCTDALYGDCDPDVAAAAIARLGPQSAVALTDAVPQPLPELADRRMPQHYVVCTRDRAVPPALQRDMAIGCDRITELDTDHSPFLSRPVELAVLLASVAASAT